jgi:3-oxoacyl-[acyl-carrier protein] reductase
MRFAGRVALVTGGGTGFGRGLSLALAQEGARVAVNYRESRREAEETVAEIGGEAIAVQADVSVEAEVEALVGRTEAELGPVDLLVNNAGIGRRVPFRDLDGVRREDWDRILGVNVVGAFLCARAVAPSMRERGFGRILNVSSNSAVMAFGSSIPYVVSKAALKSLTECLARALAPDVRVNAIAPSWMPTRWLERHVLPAIVERVASGELPSVPVADAVSLALELLANDAITGQTVVIDRGEVWALDSAARE